MQFSLGNHQSEQQRSEASNEHGQDDEEFAGDAQHRRHPPAESHGSDGGDDLKEEVDELSPTVLGKNEDECHYEDEGRQRP